MILMMMMMTSKSMDIVSKKKGKSYMPQSYGQSEVLYVNINNPNIHLKNIKGEIQEIEISTFLTICYLSKEANYLLRGELNYILDLYFLEFISVHWGRASPSHNLGIQYSYSGSLGLF